jgi:copper chaperone
MLTTVIRVEGMSCDHCLKAISGAVTPLPGITGVTVDVKAGTVEIVHDPKLSDLGRVKAEIEEQGYDVIA